MTADAILELMRQLLNLLHDRHDTLPRGPQARRYAIVITEQEQTLAYYKTWIVDAEAKEGSNAS